MGKAVLVVVIVIAVIVGVGAAWVGVGYGMTRASGPVVTEERTVPAFTKVEVSGRGTLFITQGAPSLRIEAQRDILDRLKTTVTGDILQIGSRSHWLGFDAFWGDEPVTYHLTVLDLSEIKLSGAVEAKGQGAFEAREFVFECSGSSDVALEVRADNVRLHTSGSADITLTGRADTLFCDTSGSTTIHARDLASRTATIDCSGSSDIEVNASERLDVNASGSSTVSHVGTPIITSNISGSGEVRQLTQ